MESSTLRVTTSSATVTLSGDRPHVVGRGRDADVVIAGAQVSRQHVELVPDDAGWTVRDLSANGMWHAGRRVATVAITPVDAGALARAEPTVVHLGSVNGPQLSLVAAWPAGHRPPAPAADLDPELSSMQTRIAPSSATAGRTGTKPAAGARARTAPTPVPAQTGPAGPAGTGPGTAAAPSRRPRRDWARTVPTVLWLVAAGFAIGALVALT